MSRRVMLLSSNSWAALSASTEASLMAASVLTYWRKMAGSTSTEWSPSRRARARATESKVRWSLGRAAMRSRRAVVSAMAEETAEVIWSGV